jgi:SAM-dependent MidA family methyltransferase
VHWLDRLPERFDGLVLANESSMPCRHTSLSGIGRSLPSGVGVANGQFAWRDRPASGHLLERARSLAAECAINPPYLSEVSLLVPSWVRQWAAILGSGALLLIDYGFPAASITIRNAMPEP